MNKTELVNSVAEKADITKKDAEKAVKAVFEAISESLQKDDKVQIIGFGTFEVRHRKERKAAIRRRKKPSRLPLPIHRHSKRANSLKIWLTINKSVREKSRSQKRLFSFLAFCRTMDI